MICICFVWSYRQLRTWLCPQATHNIMGCQMSDISYTWISWYAFAEISPHVITNMLRSTPSCYTKISHSEFIMTLYISSSQQHATMWYKCLTAMCDINVWYHWSLVGGGGGVYKIFFVLISLAMLTMLNAKIFFSSPVAEIHNLNWIKKIHIWGLQMEQKYTNLENIMLSNCPVLYTNQSCYIITYNIKICLLF